MIDLVLYLKIQKEWSTLTFGSGLRTEGILRHIEKEIQEVREEPLSNEWLDIVILALDGAWRSGHTPEEICAALLAKQQINLARQWPSPEGLSQDEPSLHIKE